MIVVPMVNVLRGVGITVVYAIHHLLHHHLLQHLHHNAFLIRNVHHMEMSAVPMAIV